MKDPISAGIFSGTRNTPRRAFVAQGPIEFLIRESLTPGEGVVATVCAPPRRSGIYSNPYDALERLDSLPVGDDFRALALALVENFTPALPPGQKNA